MSTATEPGRRRPASWAAETPVDDRLHEALGVRGPTPDSQTFYERLGFTLTRVRPRRRDYLP